MGGHDRTEHATGYLADRALRFYRMRRPSKILTTRILPSSVTELVIERPSGFTFRAGDFIFLLIPALSRFCLLYTSRCV